MLIMIFLSTAQKPVTLNEIKAHVGGREWLVREVMGSLVRTGIVRKSVIVYPQRLFVYYY